MSVSDEKIEQARKLAEELHERTGYAVAKEIADLLTEAQNRLDWLRRL